ncbi:type II secretion system protein [Candidatus Gottesmanbacteria bacterium]|nr:type II secretion system protein [Candidatus Gottesmanbacteria bacterium]
MVNKHSDSNQGMTLLDLIIGLAVMSIILVGTLIIAVDMLESVNRSSQFSEIEHAKNIIFTDLSNLVRWGGTVSLPSPPPLKLVVDATEYTLDTSLGYGRLMKNNEAVTSSKIDVTAFTVSNYSVTPTYASLKIALSFKDRINTQLPAETFTFAVSQRQNTN